jgi:hypothetical protein
MLLLQLRYPELAESGMAALVEESTEAVIHVPHDVLAQCER